MADLQTKRRLFQGGFFILFVLAPVFDLFRLDLQQHHFFILGMGWSLGIDDLLAHRISPLEAGLNIVLRGFLPILLVIGTGVAVSWKFGRLYCGWLCPHFSVVETLNQILRRAIGRFSVWERKSLPEQDTGAERVTSHRVWLLLWLPLALGFAFVWATVLLTYLLPPELIYDNLWHGTLTLNQSLFIGIGTGVFFLEFTLARHLFCRFGCAIGLFQSLVWMANRRAMVITFDRRQSAACLECTNACDNACPMRLKPRTLKRHMFTCTQCGRCISACRTAQGDRAPLYWSAGWAALNKSDRHRAPPGRVIPIIPGP